MFLQQPLVSGRNATADAELLSVWRKPKLRLWARIISLVVVLAFVFPYLTWAFTPASYPKPLKEICFNQQPVRIPGGLGSVEEAHQGDGRLVVYIQDLHCNYEVQSHIAQLIDALAARHGLNLVAVEGMDCPVDVSRLSDIPLDSVKRGVAEYLLREGKLSGPEHYAALGRHPIRLEGIETGRLYRANYDAVQRFLNSESQGYVYDLREMLNEIKPAVYNRELAQLDQRKCAYREGELPLVKYGAYLAGRARRSGVDLAVYPNLSRYLARKADAFGEDIDADRLFGETEELERALRAGLYTAPQQRELDAWERRLDVMEKLVNISATPEELAEFRQNREQFHARALLAFIAACGEGGGEAGDDEAGTLDTYLDQAAGFYAVADERSRSFVDNLLARMQRQGENLSVLVTGGYHSAEVLAELKRRGLSYISIKPRLARQDAVNPYFALLKNRKAPLEKLLAKNQNLFALPSYVAQAQNALHILTLAFLAAVPRRGLQAMQGYIGGAVALLESRTVSGVLVARIGVASRIITAVYGAAGRVKGAVARLNLGVECEIVPGRPEKVELVPAASGAGLFRRALDWLAPFWEWPLTLAVSTAALAGAKGWEERFAAWHGPEKQAGVLALMQSLTERTPLGLVRAFVAGAGLFALAGALTGDWGLAARAAGAAILAVAGLSHIVPHLWFNLGEPQNAANLFGRFLGKRTPQLLPKAEALAQIARYRQILQSDWEKSGALVELPTDKEILLVPDLHSRLEVLIKILNTDGNLEKIQKREAVLVILGDAIHAEGGEKQLREMDTSVEIMQFIMGLKIRNPESVYYLLGNHDTLSAKTALKGNVDQGKEFAEAINARYGEEYAGDYLEALESTPVWAVGKGIAACHAGPTLTTVEEMKAKIGTVGEWDIREALVRRYNPEIANPSRYYSLEMVEEFLEMVNQPGGILVNGHTHPDNDEHWYQWNGKINLVMNDGAAKKRVGYASYRGGKLELVEVTEASAELSEEALNVKTAAGVPRDELWGIRSVPREQQETLKSLIAAVNRISPDDEPAFNRLVTALDQKLRDWKITGPNFIQTDREESLMALLSADDAELARILQDDLLQEYSDRHLFSLILKLPASGPDEAKDALLKILAAYAAEHPKANLDSERLRNVADSYDQMEEIVAALKPLILNADHIPSQVRTRLLQLTAAYVYLGGKTACPYLDYKTVPAQDFIAGLEQQIAAWRKNRDAAERDLDNGSQALSLPAATAALGVSAVIAGATWSVPGLNLFTVTYFLWHAAKTTWIVWILRTRNLKWHTRVAIYNLHLGQMIDIHGLFRHDSRKPLFVLAHDDIAHAKVHAFLDRLLKPFGASLAGFAVDAGDAAGRWKRGSVQHVFWNGLVSELLAHAVDLAALPWAVIGALRTVEREGFYQVLVREIEPGDEAAVQPKTEPKRKSGGSLVARAAGVLLAAAAVLSALLPQFLVQPAWGPSAVWILAPFMLGTLLLLAALFADRIRRLADSLFKFSLVMGPAGKVLMVPDSGRRREDPQQTARLFADAINQAASDETIADACLALLAALALSRGAEDETQDRAVFTGYWRHDRARIRPDRRFVADFFFVSYFFRTTSQPHEIVKSYLDARGRTRSLPALPDEAGLKSLLAFMGIDLDPWNRAPAARRLGRTRESGPGPVDAAGLIPVYRITTEKIFNVCEGVFARFDDYSRDYQDRDQSPSIHYFQRMQRELRKEQSEHEKLFRELPGLPDWLEAFTAAEIGSYLRRRMDAHTYYLQEMEDCESRMAQGVKSDRQHLLNRFEDLIADIEDYVNGRDIPQADVVKDFAELQASVREYQNLAAAKSLPQVLENERWELSGSNFELYRLKKIVSAYEKHGWKANPEVAAMTPEPAEPLRLEELQEIGLPQVLILTKPLTLVEMTDGERQTSVELAAGTAVRALKKKIMTTRAGEVTIMDGVALEVEVIGEPGAARTGWVVLDRDWGESPFKPFYSQSEKDEWSRRMEAEAAEQRTGSGKTGDAGQDAGRGLPDLPFEPGGEYELTAEQSLHDPETGSVTAARPGTRLKINSIVTKGEFPDKIVKVILRVDVVGLPEGRPEGELRLNSRKLLILGENAAEAPFKRIGGTEKRKDGQPLHLPGALATAGVAVVLLFVAGAVPGLNLLVLPFAVWHLAKSGWIIFRLFQRHRDAGWFEAAKRWREPVGEYNPRLGRAVDPANPDEPVFQAPLFVQAHDAMAHRWAHVLINGLLRLLGSPKRLEDYAREAEPEASAWEQLQLGEAARARWRPKSLGYYFWYVFASEVLAHGLDFLGLFTLLWERLTRPSLVTALDSIYESGRRTAEKQLRGLARKFEGHEMSEFAVTGAYRMKESPVAGRTAYYVELGRGGLIEKPYRPFANLIVVTDEQGRIGKIYMADIPENTLPERSADPLESQANPDLEYQHYVELDPAVSPELEKAVAGLKRDLTGKILVDETNLQAKAKLTVELQSDPAVATNRTWQILQPLAREELEAFLDSKWGAGIARLLRLPEAAGLGLHPGLLHVRAVHLTGVERAGAVYSDPGIYGKNESAYGLAHELTHHLFDELQKAETEVRRLRDEGRESGITPEQRTRVEKLNRLRRHFLNKAHLPLMKNILKNPLYHNVAMIVSLLLRDETLRQPEKYDALLNEMTAYTLEAMLEGSLMTSMGSKVTREDAQVFIDLGFLPLDFDLAAYPAESGLGEARGSISDLLNIAMQNAFRNSPLLRNLPGGVSSALFGRQAETRPDRKPIVATLSWQTVRRMMRLALDAKHFPKYARGVPAVHTGSLLVSGWKYLDWTARASTPARTFSSWVETGKKIVRGDFQALYADAQSGLARFAAGFALPAVWETLYLAAPGVALVVLGFFLPVLGPAALGAQLVLLTAGLGWGIYTTYWKMDQRHRRVVTPDGVVVPSVEQKRFLLKNLLVTAVGPLLVVFFVMQGQAGLGLEFGLTQALQLGLGALVAFVGYHLAGSLIQFAKGEPAWMGNRPETTITNIYNGYDSDRVLYPFERRNGEAVLKTGGRGREIVLLSAEPGSQKALNYLYAYFYTSLMENRFQAGDWKFCIEGAEDRSGQLPVEVAFLKEIARVYDIPVEDPMLGAVDGVIGQKIIETDAAAEKADQHVLYYIHNSREFLVRDFSYSKGLNTSYLIEAQEYELANRPRENAAGKALRQNPDLLMKNGRLNLAKTADIGRNLRTTVRGIEWRLHDAPERPDFSGLLQPGTRVEILDKKVVRDKQGVCRLALQIEVLSDVFAKQPQYGSPEVVKGDVKWLVLDRNTRGYPFEDFTKEGKPASVLYWLLRALGADATWTKRLGLAGGAAEAAGLAAAFILVPVTAMPGLGIAVWLGVVIAHLPLMYLSGLRGRELAAAWFTQAGVLLGYGLISVGGLGAAALIAWATVHIFKDIRDLGLKNVTAEKSRQPSTPGEVLDQVYENGRRTAITQLLDLSEKFGNQPATDFAIRDVHPLEGNVEQGRTAFLVELDQNGRDDKAARPLANLAVIVDSENRIEKVYAAVLPEDRPAGADLAEQDVSHQRFVELDAGLSPDLGEPISRLRRMIDGLLTRDGQFDHGSVRSRPDEGRKWQMITPVSRAAFETGLAAPEGASIARMLQMPEAGRLILHPALLHVRAIHRVGRAGGAYAWKTIYAESESVDVVTHELAHSIYRGLKDTEKEVNRLRQEGREREITQAQKDAVARLNRLRNYFMTGAHVRAIEALLLHYTKYAVLGDKIIQAIESGSNSFGELDNPVDELAAYALGALVAGKSTTDLMTPVTQDDARLFVGMGYLPEDYDWRWLEPYVKDQAAEDLSVIRVLAREGVRLRETAAAPRTDQPAEDKTAGSENTARKKSAGPAARMTGTRNIIAEIERKYAETETDEFQTPNILVDKKGKPVGRVKDGDSVVFLNFRSDRTGQLCAAFLSKIFKPFRNKDLHLNFATMTDYALETYDKVLSAIPKVIEPEVVPEPLADVLAKNNVPVAKITETTKGKKHLTFFFNGRREKPYPNEKIYVDFKSPKEPTPEMRMPEVAAKAVDAIHSPDVQVTEINLCAPDMVGHEAKLDKTIQAVEKTDENLGKILKAIEEEGGVAIVTADHGNAEENVTSHTSNPVPFVYIDYKNPEAVTELKTGTNLGDVAPTLLHALNLEKPEVMTGRSLLPDGYQGGQRKVVLIVLDGWGLNPKTEGKSKAEAKELGDAIRAADTPVMDAIWAKHPHTTLEASGEGVGLRPGQEGNSEVGHINMGAGRVVPQDVKAIDHAIEDGGYFKNPALVRQMEAAKKNGKPLHLMILAQEAAVHASLEHLYATLRMAKQYGLTEVYVHAFLDGRDEDPGRGLERVREIQTQINRIGVGEIVTTMGRYWAMDRENNWERTQLAYEALANGASSNVTFLNRIFEGLRSAANRLNTLAGLDLLAAPALKWIGRYSDRVKADAVKAAAELISLRDLLGEPQNNQGYYERNPLGKAIFKYRNAVFGPHYRLPEIRFRTGWKFGLKLEELQPGRPGLDGELTTGQAAFVVTLPVFLAGLLNRRPENPWLRLLWQAQGRIAAGILGRIFGEYAAETLRLAAEEQTESALDPAEYGGGKALTAKEYAKADAARMTIKAAYGNQGGLDRFATTTELIKLAAACAPDVDLWAALAPAFEESKASGNIHDPAELVSALMDLKPDTVAHRPTRNLVAALQENLRQAEKSGDKERLKLEILHTAEMLTRSREKTAVNPAVFNRAESTALPEPGRQDIVHLQLNADTRRVLESLLSNPGIDQRAGAFLRSVIKKDVLDARESTQVLAWLQAIAPEEAAVVALGEDASRLPSKFVSSVADGKADGVELSNGWHAVAPAVAALVAPAKQETADVFKQPGALLVPFAGELPARLPVKLEGKFIAFGKALENINYFKGYFAPGAAFAYGNALAQAYYRLETARERGDRKQIAKARERFVRVMSQIMAYHAARLKETGGTVDNTDFQAALPAVNAVVAKLFARDELLVIGLLGGVEIYSSTALGNGVLWRQVALWEKHPDFVLDRNVEDKLRAIRLRHFRISSAA